MEKQPIEVADIFRLHGNRYREKYPLSPEQSKVFNLIKLCRTSALGGHMQQCDHCGHEQPAYNSCRNRHCPKCQSTAKQKWLNARSSEILPCGYFHLVFTLPHGLNPLIRANTKLLLSALFAKVGDVLQQFGKDPRWRLEGRIGILAVLHTWSQTLLDHFHLHCLVPAGALKADNQWRAARTRYLFGVKSLAKAFKHRYISELQALHAAGKLKFPAKTVQLSCPTAFGKLVAQLEKQDWIVYAKRPFAGPKQVLDYLGRYTHRVAISNHRIESMQDNKVTFTYRDRADGDQLKHMTLDAVEFIRRFLLHVLPDGFVKIRYFGFLAHRNRKKCIALIRQLIDPSAEAVQIQKETVCEMILRLTGIDIGLCPKCGKGKMKLGKPLAKTVSVQPRAPT
jgi:Putative transposase/Transposase zinc-binding domain